jgi:transposase
LDGSRNHPEPVRPRPSIDTSTYDGADVRRRLPLLQLTLEEKSRLADWVRGRAARQTLAFRARIVLECSRGATNTRVSRQLHVSKQTVGKWRHRFIVSRLDGLFDAPRRGRPHEVSDVKIEQILALTLARNPEAPLPWTSRVMAKLTGVNQTAIARIWKAAGLQVHRVETFELCPDPPFTDEVSNGKRLSVPATSIPDRRTATRYPV